MDSNLYGFKEKEETNRDERRTYESNADKGPSEKEVNKFVQHLLKNGYRYINGVLTNRPWSTDGFN